MRDDKSRILPARTCSLRTTRLVPSAAPLVVTATTRGSGTGVPPVTAEDTEHGDLKPAPDPAAGESRSRAWRTLRAGPSQAAEGPSPPAGLLGDGRRRRGVCRAPGPSSPRSLVQPCAPAPSAAAALSSAPRLRVPSPGALRLSHCVSRVPCLAPARSSACVPRRLALRRALRHPGGAARLRCLVRAPAPVRPGSCLRVALPSGARTPSGFRVLLLGPSPRHLLLGALPSARRPPRRPSSSPLTPSRLSSCQARLPGARSQLFPEG